jgi:hypothetical protein
LYNRLAAEMILVVLSLQDDVRLRVIMLLYSWWEVRNKSNIGEVVHRAAMLVMESKPARTKANKHDDHQIDGLGRRLVFSKSIVMALSLMKQRQGARLCN